MKKKERIALFVLIPVVVIFGIVALVLGFYEKAEPEEIVFPDSGLSDSIFDSQNMEYVENENFTNTYMFVNEPYKIDTIQTSSATIDTGCVFDSGNYYFYYAEVKKTDLTRDVVKEQFSRVLKYDASDEETTITALNSDSGFINGFSAEYGLYCISVNDNDAPQSAYMLCYRLIIADADDFEDHYDLIVGVATKNYTNPALDGAMQLCRANLLTLQYDKAAALDMIEDMERKAREAAEDNAPDEEIEQLEDETELEEEETTGSDSTEEIEEEAVESDSQIEYADNEPTTSESNAQGANKSMGVLLKEDYDDLSVKIIWTEKSKTPTISFSAVNGSQTFEPDSCKNGEALFHIGKAEAGVYIVNIEKGDGCGTFTAELITN